MTVGGSKVFGQLCDSESADERAHLLQEMVAAVVRLRATPARTADIVAEVEDVLARAWASWGPREIEEALAAALDETEDLVEDRIGRIFAASSVGRSFWERERHAAELSRLADLVAATESRDDGGVRRKQVQLLLHHGLLSAEDEVHVARRVRRGDVAARNYFVEMNLRLAWSYVQKTRLDDWPAIDRDDLFQQSTLGLLRAAEKFDPYRGFKFSTYASWWIKQAIQRSLADTGRTIRVPVHVDDRLRKIHAAEEKLWRRVGREPAPDEIAAEAGVPVWQVREGRAIPVTVPLDDFDADELRNPAEQPLEEIVADAVGASDVVRAFAMLPTRLQEVLRRRLGLDGHEPETLETIGDALGITRERVRQLETEALKRLRELTPAPSQDGTPSGAPAG